MIAQQACTVSAYIKTK